MFLSVEQTVSQTLPRSVLEACDQVTITHLPKHSLLKSLNTVKLINDTTGKAKAVPHIAARNIHSEAELFNACEAFSDEGVNTVLVIGGDRKTALRYSSSFEICRQIQSFKFRQLCGVYPQSENMQHVIKKKYASFSEGVTQFCLKPSLLNEFTDSTRIGVPSNCSVQQLIKFARMCGVIRSFKTCLDNLEGVKYLDTQGFNTRRFVNRLDNTRIHIYNFGRIEQTVASLRD